MKVVILAGGFGTRISEESMLRPKPMVEIGERPILWHIMKHYSNYGYNEFIICLGYKGYCIKEYFANFYLHESDVTFCFKNSNEKTIHGYHSGPWTVTLINTGLNTMTGGRLKRIQPFVNNETFMLTYGDGVSDVNLHELVSFHKLHHKTATVTAVQPPGRFGAMNLNERNEVFEFVEKPRGDGSWINAGFFVMEPEIFNYLEDDSTVLEKEPLQNLARDGELVAYRHNSFWQPMDTLRDKNYLESLWQSGKAPWRSWENDSE